MPITQEITLLIAVKTKLRTECIRGKYSYIVVQYLQKVFLRQKYKYNSIYCSIYIPFN